MKDDEGNNPEPHQSERSSGKKKNLKRKSVMSIDSDEEGSPDILRDRKYNNKIFVKELLKNCKKLYEKITILGKEKKLLSMYQLQYTEKSADNSRMQSRVQSRMQSRMQFKNTSAHKRECRRNLFDTRRNTGKWIMIMLYLIKISSNFFT